ncbi:rhomboid family intramembrane serine protease [Halobacteriovorax sp. GB3]|uniref:rhomboid family intramembrane serine protease n=1 Tax=Halobacteriovorax sp. GB3 TaxID=2719615 RepID=UPI00235E7BEB|nr:rhomboid family intramembrane serine protease [Halobacteriovorax sp. GB3]MDD0851645.1 rhomboid family intramembrane serine protease [Halobacteriovorax sp. GB3]
MIEVKRELISNFLSLKKTSPNSLAWSLGTLLVCYIMSSLYWGSDWSHLLAASGENVFLKNDWYRLFTSTFVHGDLEHFLSNSLMLVIMGHYVHYHFGAKLFPLVAFLSGAIINFIVILNLPEKTHLVGASGVVHWLWGFWFILYFKVQRHIPLTRRIMKIVIVGLVILFPTKLSPNVSYLAHFVGLLLGMITGLFYYYLNAKNLHSFEQWKSVITVIDPEYEREALGASENDNSI